MKRKLDYTFEPNKRTKFTTNITDLPNEVSKYFSYHVHECQ